MTDEIFHFKEAIPLNDIASVWIKAYRANRYLKSLSNLELADRLSDITQNFMVFDEITGKHKLNIHIGEDRIYKPVKNLDWMKLATDAYDEYRIRGLSIPELPSLAQVLACEKKLWNSGWAKRGDLIEASTPPLDRYEVPKLLFRYSGKKYNKDLVDFGLLRVSPASTYSDSSLSRAQRDDEKIMEVADSGGYFETDNFHVACFSAIYSYRMFCEFKSDSCVVIRDVQEFQKRFNKAIERCNRKSSGLRVAKVQTCPIFYYDPHNILNPIYADEIFLSKPFRFAYQHEFRIVVLPTKPQPLEYLYLELGSLADIAELVCEA